MVENTTAAAVGQISLFTCSECGAEMAVEAGRMTARCPYCDTSTIVERPPTRDRPALTFVIGFAVKQKDAVAATRAWLRRHARFARSGFAKARFKKPGGVYLPAYLYGALARCRYRASIGESYTVVETYTTSRCVVPD